MLIPLPSKLNMKPACYVADARAKGVSVTEALTKSLKRQLTCLRNRSDGLINGHANNWGNSFRDSGEGACIDHTYSFALSIA